MGNFLGILFTNLPPIARMHLFLARLAGTARNILEARLNWKMVSPP